MTLTLETWHVISLIITIFGGLVGGAKLFFGRVEDSIKQRDQQLADALDKIDAKLEKESEAIRRIDRDLLTLKAELPREYVTKNDFVRSFTVVEHKLDALANKLELANIKVAMTGKGDNDG